MIRLSRALALLAVSLLAVTAESSLGAGAMVRVVCEAADAGSEVSLNGQFKGECPVDVAVPAGEVRVRVYKRIDSTREQVYEQTVRVGDGVVKRVEVVMPPPRLNSEAQKIEDERQRVVRVQREEQERQREAAQRAAAQAKRDRLASTLAEFAARDAAPGNGRSYSECADCPEMVLVPRPSSPPFAIGRYEVTRRQFAVFVRETGHVPAKGCVVFVGGWLTKLHELWQSKADADWMNPRFVQTDDHPVVCVSYLDAVAYTNWLSRKTGHAYRLPNNEQWTWGINEGSDAVPDVFHKPGAGSVCAFANVLDSAGDREVSTGLGKAFGCSDGQAFTAPVGRFPPNRFGVFDGWGNVAEYVLGQRAETLGNRRVMLVQMRGLSWASGAEGVWPNEALSSELGRQSTGFRVVRELSEE